MNPRECPHCGWKTGVVETRKNGTRRRECLNPGCSFRRDYDNIDEIVGYLKRITAGRDIRQGCATIRVNDGRSTVLNWNLELEAWEAVEIKQ